MDPVFGERQVSCIAFCVLFLEPNNTLRRKQRLGSAEEVAELVVRKILGEALDNDTIVSLFTDDVRCHHCINTKVVADG